MRGGKRAGSGRKKHYGEPTKAVKIPESRIEEVKSYLRGELDSSPSDLDLTPSSPISSKVLEKNAERLHNQVTNLNRLHGILKRSFDDPEDPMMQMLEAVLRELDRRCPPVKKSLSEAKKISQRSLFE